MKRILIALALIVLPSLAQAKPLGMFGDWIAYVENEGGQILCFMLSEPAKSAGKYTKRGDPYFMLSHRPAEKRNNEVSIIAGYTYKKGSQVTLTVDGKTTFKLFTEGDSAWAKNAAMDKKIAVAMRRGNEMVVKGESSRGTKTTDTYSLTGVTASFKKVNKACGL